MPQSSENLPVTTRTPEPVDDTSPRPRRIRHGLLWKEWMEHRWRFLSGAVALTLLLGGMLRAQVLGEELAAIAIFWPIGTLLTISLAIGTMSVERAGGTWEFLLAQPVSRRRLLLAKWFVGILELWGVLAMGCVVGLMAMWSRGFNDRWNMWETQEQFYKLGDHHWLAFLHSHPAFWLIALTFIAVVVLSCWYTFLFFVLTRARNDFAATLGGILLTVAVTVWAFQHFFESLRLVSLLNPFTNFFLFVRPGHELTLLYVVPIQIVVWIGAPLAITWWRTRRPVHE